MKMAPPQQDHRGMLCYSALDQSVSSIRLLRLQPEATPDAEEPTIVCDLTEVMFRDKPKYECLSYTWGTDVESHIVKVNGFDFAVRSNLYNALIRLRGSDKVRVVWIDAICINQADIEERNRQLRIMSYIYSRAQSVLVWLGHDPSVDDQVEDYVHSRDQWEAESLLENLCQRDYWNRVWIVQEIGKARQVQIYYNGINTEWSNFIKHVDSFTSLAGSLPLRLAKHLEFKYEKGTCLQNLLENHQEALCSERRDKIYGFVGLASDVHGRLPLDYGKSLFEIYVDVVTLLNGIYDIVSFSKLVVKLLGGSGTVTPDDVIRKANLEKSPTIVEYDDPGTVESPARVVGVIGHIGPTYNEIMSQPEKMDEWTLAIRNYLTKWMKADDDPMELARAFAENDAFMEVLEDLDEVDKARIFHSDREIFWDMKSFPAFNEGKGWYNHQEPMKRRLFVNSKKHKDKEEGEDSMQDAGSNSDTVTPGELESDNVMFALLLRDSTLKENHSAICLVPGEAQIGDYVCELTKHDLAAIVRRQNSKATIIGSAGLAHESEVVRLAKLRNRALPPGFSTPQFNSNRPSTLVKLYMHVTTLYELSQ